MSNVPTGHFRRRENIRTCNSVETYDPLAQISANLVLRVMVDTYMLTPYQHNLNNCCWHLRHEVACVRIQLVFFQFYSCLNNKSGGCQCRFSVGTYSSMHITPHTQRAYTSALSTVLIAMVVYMFFVLSLFLCYMARNKINRSLVAAVAASRRL